MTSSAVTRTELAEHRSDDSYRVSALAPVAGMAMRHERESSIEFAEAPAWAGSAETQKPVLVRHVVSPVSTEGLRKRFDASPSCTFYDRDGDVVVRFRGPTPSVPDQLLVARRAGHEYEMRYAGTPGTPMYQHAKDRTVFSMALAQRGRGYIAHACGFLLGGTGVLCPGLPSAGKSTLARLLGMSATGVERLSDDRIALTRDEGVYRTWGTPWPGDERVIGAGDGRLGVIVLLRHATAPTLLAVPRAVAARRLLDTLVLPLWDRALLPDALEFVGGLVDEIPVMEFAYPPTVDAVAWMLGELERRGFDA